VVNWTQLNGADWVMIVVITLSVMLSLWRGFAREALSLAGWLVAYVVANLFGGALASLLSGLISNVTGRYVVAYTLLFVGTLMLSGVIAMLTAQLVKVTGLSLLDRILGMVFGFARGLILIVVFVFVIRHLVPPEDLEMLYQSQFMPHIDMLSQWGQAMFDKFKDGQWSAVTT
jgi:membrane protein required for colicin V production